MNAQKFITIAAVALAGAFVILRRSYTTGATKGRRAADGDCLRYADDALDCFYQVDK